MGLSGAQKIEARGVLHRGLSLKHQGRVSNNFACVLLEQTIKSEVLHGILLTNTDISILDNFHTKVLKVGHNMEQLQILCGSAFKYSQCHLGEVPTSWLLEHSQGPVPQGHWHCTPRTNSAKGKSPMLQLPAVQHITYNC